MNSGGWRENPREANGEVNRCLICDSRFHWARDCPYAYESKREELAETRNFNYFVGYARCNDGKARLTSLVEKVKRCAILDSGCSMTV